MGERALQLVAQAAFQRHKGTTLLYETLTAVVINDGILAAGFKLARREPDDCALDPEGHHQWKPLGNAQHCQACGDVSEPFWGGK